MADEGRPGAGHAEALRALVEERYTKMVGYAARQLRTRDVPRSSADPEDVVHTALSAALARTEPIGKMRAYTYKIIQNEIDRAARLHHSGRGYASLDADVRLEDEPAAEPVAEAELRHVVTQALNGLPLQQRRVMLLMQMGMTHAEAARVLNVAPRCARCVSRSSAWAHPSSRGSRAP
ncbi:RNA polymerase sigma factor (sigma-70 family) [Streptomyces sp. SAI-170]|uniref:RNA polymerase sigma factor n=1 Tax=Streptomyces sp. SAI-170 TaxID=3377729 RepID=UPI003C7C2BA2